MRLDVALWRALPVRGPGRLIAANLKRRTRRGQVTAIGPRGIRVLVDPRNPPEVSVYMWGTYEPEVLSALERVLRPGCTAVDVGANCGVLSVFMRRLAGAAGRVVAVDPSPAAGERLREQAAANGMADICVIQAALGSGASRETFRAGRVGIGMLPKVDAQFTTGDSLDIQVLTLDDIVTELDFPPVGVIKIDTDGSELAVLAGARELLQRERPVLVFEVFGDGMRRRGVEPAALADLLEAYEYDLFVAESKSAAVWHVGPRTTMGFRAAPLNDLARGEIDQQNVVAISRLEDGAAAREALLAATDDPVR